MQTRQWGKGWGAKTSLLPRLSRSMRGRQRARVVWLPFATRAAVSFPTQSLAVLHIVALSWLRWPCATPHRSGQYEIGRDSLGTQRLAHTGVPHFRCRCKCRYMNPVRLIANMLNPLLLY
jgi:hypothetical protein